MKTSNLIVLLLTIVLIATTLIGCGKKNNTPAPDGEFTFECKSINGDSVHYEDFKDAKVIMINMWEPWCGPCVNEMPELNELYNEYKDSGLVIIGSYTDTSASKDAQNIVKELGIDYPIVIADDNINAYATAYVPTTIFVDNKGNVLTKEPYIGSLSKKEWDSTIRKYLE